MPLHRGDPVTLDRTTRWGAREPRVTVRAGVIDDEARSVYRQGQCHALALALSNLTGWPVWFAGSGQCAYDDDPPACGSPECPTYLGLRGQFAFNDDLCSCQVDHIVVRRPDGMLIDIDGAWTVAGLAERHQYDGAWPVPPGLLDDLRAGRVGWLKPDLEAAHLFAEAILEQIGG